MYIPKYNFNNFKGDIDKKDLITQEIKAQLAFNSPLEGESVADEYFGVPVEIENLDMLINDRLRIKYISEMAEARQEAERARTHSSDALPSSHPPIGKTGSIIDVKI